MAKRRPKPIVLNLERHRGSCPAAALLNGPAARRPVIALSRRPESEAAALNAGADAFVSKANPPEEVLETLRALVLGRRAEVLAQDGLGEKRRRRE